MAWYKTGTIAIANGSPTLTGTSTDFVSNVQAGHGVILPDGRTYEVLTVNSATSITLSTNYQGTTVASGGAYLIVPTQGFAQAAAAALAQLITDYQAIATGAGAGRFGDGTVSAPGISFAADQDTGLWRTGANAFAAAVGGSGMTYWTSTGFGVGGAPNAKFDVLSASNSLMRVINDSNRGRLRVYRSSADAYGEIWHDGTDTQINSTAGAIALGDGSTIWARLTAGDLILGDTVSTSGINLVRSGATSAELKLKQTGASGRDFRLSSTGSGYGAAGNLIIYDATAGAERWRMNNAGAIGQGATSLTGYNYRIGATITGSTSAAGVFHGGVVQSDVTGDVAVFSSSVGLAAASFTLGDLTHFSANQAAIGAGATLTAQQGFKASAALIGAAANYGFRANDTSAVGPGKASTGFYSAIDIATGGGTTRAFHGAGTAPNVFRGKTRVGGTSDPSVELDVTGDVAASGTVKPGSYTVGTVPSASGKGAGATIYVSNESGGAVLAFSDATNWRRVTDRAIIS